MNQDYSFYYISLIFLNVIMNETIINKLKHLKNQYLKEGFIIEGVFGSYAKGAQEERSDIDILFELNQEFKLRNKGFKAIARLDEIQNEISEKLGVKADLAQKSALGKIAAKYILPEIVYV